jgi:four helix bundle protein
MRSSKKPADKREAFKARTKAFAINCVRFASQLPNSQIGRNIDNQLTRSATSVAANYGAACRSRSAAECLARMGVVEEEADECLFWLELSVEFGLDQDEAATNLMREANELVAIAVSSRRNLKQRILSSKSVPNTVKETTHIDSDPFAATIFDNPSDPSDLGPRPSALPS